MTNLVEIAVGDEFSNATGQFPNYDVYDQAQLQQLRQQMHVDVRTFDSDVTYSIPMAILNTDTMTALDAFTMAVLEGSSVLRKGEAWTSGVVGIQSDRNHWRGISLSCVAGSNTTSSTIPATAPATGLRSIDISASDYISVALPALPLGSLTTASCFIDFTSESSANFTTGPTDSVAFSSSTTTLVSGDSEFRFPVSLLATIDKSSITGVRFRIQATGVCTFRCLAVRAVSADWVYAPLDLNTRIQQIEAPVSLNGTTSSSPAFPAATAPITPTDWPYLYRSDSITGAADPRPINSHMGIVFNSGSLTNAVGTNYNVISLHFRELGLDEYTQLDLDGGTFNQARLNALGHQPDFGRALFNSRTQQDLDAQDQEILDTQTQFSLERVQDFLSAAYLEMKLSWSNTGALFSIKNADGVGYSFQNFSLSANTRYILITDLEESYVRARIYIADAQGNIGWSNPTFDTTAIIDDTFVHRRRGRFGWYATLRDGDAYISNIRPRGLTFAEYKSHRLLSDTPVDGAQLFVQASPDRDLITGLGNSPWGGAAVLDNSKSESGHAYKVQTSYPLQGVITNPMVLDDFEQTYIEFDLWFPSEGIAQGIGLEAFLYGELGRIVQLYIPPIIPDRWQPIHIELAPLQEIAQTGSYKLVLAQSTGNNSITWYIDDLVGVNRTLAWEGRGKATDPWGMNAREWTPFGVTINSDTDGALFSERGDEMQVRGEARRQNAQISTVKVVPKYSQLGRFLWPDQITLDGEPLTPPTVTLTSSGRTVTLTGNGGPFFAYYWTFGDGTFDYGKTVTHTYKTPGTYTALCMRINPGGRKHLRYFTITV